MSENGIQVLVRFAPDGTVTQIGERPEGVAPQAWFNHLTRHAGDTFRALSGGRGAFRLGADRLEAARAAWTPDAEAA